MLCFVPGTPWQKPSLVSERTEFRLGLVQDDPDATMRSAKCDVDDRCGFTWEGQVLLIKYASYDCLTEEHTSGRLHFRLAADDTITVNFDRCKSLRAEMIVQ